MAQRNSNYERKPRDEYNTPEWVTKALVPYLPLRIKTIWEPAAGGGKMSTALAGSGYDVIATDIATTKDDFLYINKADSRAFINADAIITNPPFFLAQKFIEHALELMKPNLWTSPKRGVVAMLLNADYDSAKTRRHLFGDCPQFARKIVLTKRIVWFEKKGAAPSANHCWYLWDYSHSGSPVISYWYENDILPQIGAVAKSKYHDTLTH